MNPGKVASRIIEKILANQKNRPGLKEVKRKWTKLAKDEIAANPRRITGQRQKDDVPCEWCDTVKPTTIEEVWSEANPEGRLVRICKDCGGSCAGG